MQHPPAPAGPRAPGGGVQRIVQLGLGAALLQLHLLPPPAAPLLLIGGAAPAPPAAAPGLEPGFAGQMTPDDVARGLRALAARPPDAGGLRPDQRAALAPLVAEAAAARAEVDRLRAARRAAREHLRAAALALLDAAPPAARAAARAGAR